MKELLEEDLVGWLFVLAVIVGGVVGVHYFLGQRRRWTLASRIPDLPSLSWLPLLRLVFSGFDGAIERFRKTPVSDGEVFKLWMGTRLFVFISNPADVELVLSSHDRIEKSPERKLLQPWMGDGLSICSGKKWKGLRKTVASVFHPTVLKSFLPAVDSKAAALVDKLQEVDGQDMHRSLSQTVIDILLETVMGVDMKNETGSQEYIEAIRKLREIIRQRQNKLWQRIDLVFQLWGRERVQDQLEAVIHRFTREAIKRRKEEYIKHGYCLPGLVKSFEDENRNIHNDTLNNNGPERYKEDKRRLTLLDLMLESWQDCDLLLIEVQNQIDNIMFESCEPVIATVTNFLQTMADRPDIQAKCVEEVQRIFGETNRSSTFEDTLAMNYMERCLMETLRMNPPVPVIARQLKQELHLASTNLTIPAESTVIIDVEKVHRRPDVYSHPEVFDPDNFLLDNAASRHYYSYLPFSAGPRSCVGRKFSLLKLKVLLSRILRRFHIQPGNESSSNVNHSGSSKRFNVRLAPRKM